jgi:hypothetical protein
MIFHSKCFYILDMLNLLLESDYKLPTRNSEEPFIAIIL